jgi:hypothetical protein
MGKNISEEEKKRHLQIIQEYGKFHFGKTPTQISLIGSGYEKGVYKVEYADNIFVASAAARDAKRSLLEEYNILNELYGGASNLFPRPIAHFSADSGIGDLIAMELLPHKNINRLEPLSVSDFYRNLARKIGEAIAVINAKTGRYSSEPHDENVLGIIKNGDIELKFCDAIQFKKGNLYSTVEAILIDPQMRPECFRFIKHFREGLVDGISVTENIPREEAYPRLNFLRKFNDIF